MHQPAPVRTGPHPLTVLLILAAAWLLLSALPAGPQRGEAGPAGDSISREIPRPRFGRRAPGEAEHLVGYVELRRVDPDSALRTVGMTGWICSSPSPYSLYDDLVFEQWKLQVVTRVHELVHQEQYGRYPSCQIAHLHMRVDPSVIPLNEAEAYCREIPAGVAVGFYASVEAGVAETARLLAGYGFGWSEEEAARRIRAACDLPRGR